MTTPIVEFGELPPHGNGGPSPSELDAIVAELKARPGDWAKVYPAAPRTIAEGRRRDLRRRGCEVTTRQTEDPTRRDVWARWPKVEEAGQ